MSEKIKLLVRQYQRRECSKAEFVKQIQEEIGIGKENFGHYFEKILADKNPDDVESALTILYALDENNNLIDFIHQLLLAPWHTKYEALVHELQQRKQPESVPFIKEAMQKKFPYPESYETGTRQFINQCGHALWSIGTEAAIQAIRELSESQDPVLRDEMCYRLSRIEGRNDYQRND